LTSSRTREARGGGRLEKYSYIQRAAVIMSAIRPTRTAMGARRGKAIDSTAVNAVIANTAARCLFIE
jgi:hypothetical protein